MTRRLTESEITACRSMATARLDAGEEFKAVEKQLWRFLMARGWSDRAACRRAMEVAIDVRAESWLEWAQEGPGDSLDLLIDLAPDMIDDEFGLNTQQGRREMRAVKEAVQKLKELP